MAETSHSLTMNLIRTWRFSKCLFSGCDGRRGPAGHPGDDGAGPAGEIEADVCRPVELEPRRAEDPAHRLGLIGTDLDQDFAAWRKGLAGGCGDAAIGVEPIDTAVESKARIVARHLRRQASDL